MVVATMVVIWWMATSLPSDIGIVFIQIRAQGEIVSVLIWCVDQWMVQGDFFFNKYKEERIHLYNPPLVHRLPRWGVWGGLLLGITPCSQYTI